MLSQGELLRNPSRTILQRPLKPRIKKPSLWSKLSRLFTCLIPNFLLRWCGMATEEVQHAWREKVALCMCIFGCWIILTFLTYGMNSIVCKGNNQYVYGQLHKAKFEKNIVITNGSIYYTDDDSYEPNQIYTGTFENKSPACKKAFGRQLLSGGRSTKKLERIAPICFDWAFITKNNFITIGNKVYDPSLCNEDTYENFIKKYSGTEAKQDYLTDEEWECFKDAFFSGEIATKTPGCFIADTFLYITTVIIFSLIIAKFVLATVYSWHMRRKVRPTEQITPCILLVTAYSEDEEGLRKTLDSLCQQQYNYDRKLIIIISDGEITGEENEKSTPDIILDLMDVDDSVVEPKSYVSLMPGAKRINKAKVFTGYYNSRDKSTMYNKCRILFIRKCGNSSESFKAGNRGKRDTQVILMSFFSKLIYGDRMSELDFELYLRLKKLMPEVEPVDFEAMLMVDADTIVKPDALSKMVSIFETDPKVIGICGETMILNKCESWVSMIQVFEYYISHHLSKTFESVFGGLTCLPGCFCMYRIKIITDEDGNVITGFKSVNSKVFSDDSYEKNCLPILANPFIINSYSVFEAKTLHQKNLLHLGEDRYLTTLLLKNFYKRKLIFVPQAKCETYVPSKFKVLLSQRRRWINSTIHNLLELMMVDKLCGVFCCSMQFVVIVELFGTLVLPAAILFTGVLIVSSILYEPAWIPLIMLFGIFILPAFLILITTLEVSYIFWLFVYILSIPIWNFVLPIYAFWHFDDFSWGDTRKVTGENKEEVNKNHEQEKIKLMELEDYLKEINE